MLEFKRQNRFGQHQDIKKNIQQKRFKSRMEIIEKISKLFKNRGRGKNTFRNIDLMIIDK